MLDLSNFNFSDLTLAESLYKVTDDNPISQNERVRTNVLTL
jgi:hypothetical protein